MIDKILEDGCKDMVLQVLDNATQTSALQIIRDTTHEMKMALIQHIALSLSNSKTECDDLIMKLESM